MKINSIGYCIQQGFKNIWRHKLYSLASVATMSACIFMFGIFYCLLINVDGIVKEAESGVSVTVFFEENLTQENIDEIGKKLKDRDEVSEINYVSADAAWDEFQNIYFEDAPELAEGFADDNPLANSSHFEIYLNDVSQQKSLLTYIDSLEGIRKVNASRDVADILSNLNRLIYYVSFALIGLLMAVSIFLICNTIVMGIQSRKEELKIMRLIGATKAFIKTPFLIEGIMIGLFGTMLPLSALYYSYSKMCNYLSSEFDILSGILKFVEPDILFKTLLPVSLVIGLGVSFLSSFIATNKHLKV